MAFPAYEATAPVFIRQLREDFGERCMIVLDQQRMSYAEADTRSAKLALGLLASGVVKGTRVGILFPNGPDWVVAFLAATRIGAIAVPLNTFFQPRELGWMLRHADVHTLLTVTRFLNNDYLERLETAVPELAQATDSTPGSLRAVSLPYLRSVFHFDPATTAGGALAARAWTSPAAELTRAAGRIDESMLRAAEHNVCPADAMMILYSSGSTADPKGAVHSHGGVIRHSFNLFSRRDLKPDDRVWSPMPFFWVGGLVFALMGNLHAGATTLCEEVFEPETTLRFLERERVTIAVGWPHFGKALADHPSRTDRDLSSLRAGNVPDLLPESIVPLDPELRPNALGMTETCGPHPIDRMDIDLPEALRGSFGHSVPGVEHKIVDPKTGERLPTGEFGEICVRGYSLMQGLYKVEREDVFDADGFYHTGDGGFFNPEGVLFFKSRLGDLIKTGGANVSPVEIETALSDCPGLRAGLAVGIPHPTLGEVVILCALPNHGSAPAPETIRGYLRDRLAAYKVPRHILFFEEDEIEFTGSQKIQLAPLRDEVERRLCATKISIEGFTYGDEGREDA